MGGAVLARPLRRVLAVVALGLGLVLAPAPSSAQAADREAAEDTQPTRLDLNAASESDLVALPGIGPARAAAVVALRTRLGGFQRVEDLLRVQGIGRATLAKIRPLVTVRRRP
jgi:competence protein ComEA